MTVVWSRRAIGDLRKLRAYIAKDRPDAAAHVARRIVLAVETLAQFPSMGRPGRIAGTRELIVSDTPFIVPYTMTNGDVVVVAVLHAARRWPQEFKPRSGGVPWS